MPISIKKKINQETLRIEKRRLCSICLLLIDGLTGLQKKTIVICPEESALNTIEGLLEDEFEKNEICVLS